MSSWIRMHLNLGFRRVPRRRVCRRLGFGMQDVRVDAYGPGSGAAELGPEARARTVPVCRGRAHSRFASAAEVSVRVPHTWVRRTR